MPFVSERWLGGTLTNYRTIRNRLKRLQELEAMWLPVGENPNRVDLNSYIAGLLTEAGKLDPAKAPDTSDIRTHSKKMISTLSRELLKIRRNLMGIRDMVRPPEALVIVGPNKEHIAVKEAKRMGITTIAAIDTDSDPDPVDLPIPGNDDSIRSIEVILAKLADACLEGRALCRRNSKAASANRSSPSPRRRPAPVAAPRRTPRPPEQSKQEAGDRRRGVRAERLPTHLYLTSTPGSLTPEFWRRDMAAVTPQMVKQLRDRTDQPMGLWKQAASMRAPGDMEKALDWLQKQNSKMTAKREGNETAEGRIGIFVDNAAKVAGIVEMRCESTPSAKSNQLVSLANDLAKHAPTSKAADVPAFLAEKLGAGTVQDRIDSVVGIIREKMILHRFRKLEGGLFGGYVHHDGTVGVIIECKGGCGERGTASRRCHAHRGVQIRPTASIAEVPAEVMAEGAIAGEGRHGRRPEERGQAGEYISKRSPMANSARSWRKSC